METLSILGVVDLYSFAIDGCRLHHLMTSQAGLLFQPVEGNKHIKSHDRVTRLSMAERLRYKNSGEWLFQVWKSIKQMEHSSHAQMPNTSNFYIQTKYVHVKIDYLY